MARHFCVVSKCPLWTNGVALEDPFSRQESIKVSLAAPSVNMSSVLLQNSQTLQCFPITPYFLIGKTGGLAHRHIDEVCRFGSPANK